MTMRSALLVMLLALFAAPAWAGDQPDVHALLADLKAKAEDPSATRQERWRAYKDAKEAMAGLKGEAEEAAKAEYMAMREVVAASLRRDSVPLGGWIMGILAALLLWGGFSLHLWIAAKRSGNLPPLEEDTTWPERPEEEP